MEKRLIRIIVAAFLLASPAVVGISDVCVEAGAAVKSKKQLRTVVFKTHLHCQNCVKKVVENISYVKGVEDLKVSLENQSIAVTFDANRTSAGAIAEEIKKLGYPAIEVKQ